MVNCLKGCVSNFLGGPIQVPIDGNNIGPWVRVFFADGEGETISVGNQSSPGLSNHAVIKSFEYGSSNGVQCKVEIIDEEGGAFEQFIQKLLKCINESSKSYNMKVQFGWIVANCEGNTTAMSSPVLTFSLINIEITLSEGKIKFTIHGQDIFQAVFVSREDKNFGTDDNPMRIKNAIQKLMSGEEPKINVEYFRKSASGSISTFDFDPEFGPGGPKAVWTSDNQNKLNTAMKWLEPFVTDRKKGITPKWDSTASDPTVILWEDLTPDCQQQVSAARIIGTYVVNGGQCSNVISFSPNINWIVAFSNLASGGDTGSATTGETKKKQPTDTDCAVQSEKTGVQQSIQITGPALAVYGPKQALEQTNKAQQANNRANSSVNSGVIQPITAELRIQGDPSFQFCSLKDWAGKFVAIVVINPFHLADTGDGGCGDWLAQPGCNAVLSNRHWRIESINHQIKEGSFTTTLKVVLDTPGFNYEAGTGLGGDGFQIENAC